MFSLRRIASARTVAALACLAPFATAQAAIQKPEFAPPVRLKAGDKFMGENRLYPSPVFHDMNGDGRPDIVVGDLIGRMTVALRQPGDGPARYGAESKFMGADGKELDFHNW
jgi:hypothetical protein